MLSKRQESLLVSIINQFIETAQPVSSSFLEKNGFFGLSSATIRNEMCDLEEAGFLDQRHTSGGRIPTDKAYRYYVDNLISEKCRAQSEKYNQEIKNAIWEADDDPRQINKAIAQILSDLTGNLVVTAIDEEDDFYKIGLSGLFEQPDFQDRQLAVDRMIRLTGFFEEFEEMFGRLIKRMDADVEDFRIMIGQENPMQNIRDETVIFARYNLPDNYTGSITLIGPTRMDYQKNIRLIKYVANELNKLAKQT